MFAIAAAMLAACSKDDAEEIIGTSENAIANSVLQVTTRAGGNDAIVAYPVQVYVFQGDECRAVQTIGDEGQTLNIALVEGMYSVYAVGGASATDYTLPTKDNATTTTALTLKEGRTLTDLMTASAVATLVDGGTNTVALGMTRKTMLIQDVTIKKIPTAATAVSVTIAPLWQSLTVGGTYSTAGQSQTIALTKQSDNRTWTLPAPLGEGSFPAVGDTYEGCYVLAVTEIDETSAELTLLSPNELAVASASDADAALATLGMDGISDWAVPTKAQMDAFYAAKDGVTPAPAGTYYIWQGSTSLKKRNMSTGDDSSFASGAYLRPVAVVSVTKE